MVSIWIRHCVLYRPYMTMMISKKYHNGIFYFGSGVDARFLTSNGRYRVLSGIGSNLYHVVLVNTSVQHSVAIIKTISKWCFSLKSDFPM